MTSHSMQAFGLASTAPLPAPVDLPRIREHGGVIFLAVRKDSRPAVATTIERLINYLDVLDGDPDTEEAGDEADASWPEVSGPRAGMAHPHEDDEDTNDREADNADDELDGSDEPEEGDPDGEFAGSDRDPAGTLADLCGLAGAWAAASPQQRAAALAYAREQGLMDAEGVAA